MTPKIGIIVGLATFAMPAYQTGHSDVIILRSDRIAGRVILAPNRSIMLALPQGKSRKIVSFLKVPSKLHYGDFVWNDRSVRSGPRLIRIDLRRQIISIFRGGFEIGTAVILYGADGKPTPRGFFVVRERLRDHRSSLYDAPMPYTIRLTDDGISIHGSNVRARAATHGCVGVPTEFARRLFDDVRQGDPVVIL